MRRLILPVALVAALLLFLALRPGTRGRADPQRGAATPEEAATPRRAGGEAAAPTEGAPADAGPEEARARVHGMVMGPNGAMWCAKIIAYRDGTNDELAETFTDPEGRYTLALDASDFDLAVEPAAGVWVAPPPRRAIVLNEGDDLEENFALGKSATVAGRVVDRDGEGCASVTVLVVRPEDAGPDDAHPNAVLDRALARSRTGSEGGFRMGGFPAGTYRLVVGDPGWTLAAPVSASTDGPDASLTVVPAIAVDFEVKDIETGEPVDAFSVKVTVGDRVVIEGRGAGGVFSRRVPTEDRDARSWAQLEIVARGFLPSGSSTIASRARQTVWLVPLREPNTVIRVSFDDGRPYRGGVRVLFAGKDGRSGSGVLEDTLIGRLRNSLALERVEDGVFRGGMPRGRWSVFAVPVDAFGMPRLEGELEVAEGRDAEARFVLPAGGELTLVPPPGVALSTVSIGPVGGQPGVTVEVLAEGRRIEGIPPGLYRLGYPKTTYRVDPRTAKLVGAKDERIATHTVEWFRDVRVVAGGAEEIRLPPP